MKKSILAVAVMALGGCGGSDGQLITGPVNPSPAAALATENLVDGTDTVDQTPSPDTAESVAETTSDLLSDRGFEFQTQWEMTIDFDIADATGKEGFLSICSSFEFDGESAYDVDFDSCSVRASIFDGNYNDSMNVTNDIEALLAVIWFPDEFDPPLFNEFSINNGQEQIAWR